MEADNRYNCDQQTLTETEKKLMALWMELLRCDTISLVDTFFDLGGDSIDAMLCANRIHQDLACNIRFSVLLTDHMTLRNVAELIEATRCELTMEQNDAWGHRDSRS
jgi:acyl carrier protein